MQWLSETRFRELAALSSDWYWELDEHLRVSFVSDGFQQRTGVAPEAAIGRQPGEFFGSRSPAWARGARKLLARRAFRDLELACTGQDGRRRVFSLSGNPVSGADGGFLGFRGIGRDVTARKADEARLIRLRAGLDAFGDALYLVDARTLRIVDVNDAACRASGYSRRELLGRTPSLLFAGMDDEALRGAYDAMKRALVGFELLPGEHVRKDGSRFPVEVRRQYFATAEGEFVLGIARDISHRVAQDKAVQAGKARLELHAARQEKLARFGEFALKRRDEDALIRGALDALAGEAAAVAFFEREGSDTLLLRQACGPGTGPAIGARARLHPGSAASRVLEGGGTEQVGRDYLAACLPSWPWAGWMQEMQAGVFVPVTHSGHAYGVLGVFVGSGSPSAGAVRFAESVAHVLSAALQREQAEKAALMQARRIERIASLGELALRGIALEQLVEQCLAAATEEGADAALVLEVAAEHNAIVVRAARGVDATGVVGRALELCAACPVQAAACAEEPLVAAEHGDGACACEHGRWSAAGMRSSVNVRILGAGRPFGVLSVLSRRAGGFTADDTRHFQSIANVLSSAVQRRQAEERLAHLARYDALTGLPNRSLLEDRLSQMLLQSRRREACSAVLFLDLDRFKLVNDTLGHAAGDALLREAAARLRCAVRDDDVVSRLSGDEFVVALAEVARADDAGLVAQKCLDELSRPFELPGGDAFVSASIGIAIAPENGTSAAELLRAADLAMYRAKSASRNSYRFFTPEMDQRAADRLLLQADLRHALERREFVLHFQPKVDLAARRIVGFEALLRWRHPQRGLVGPAEFIPALEESGLIAAVGEWALQEACGRLRAWRDAGVDAVPMAVNLSVKQFRRPHLDRAVQQALAAAGVPASLLELEITESCIADDPADAVRQMRNLSAAGVRIFIDDFGTGYSSLAYLTQLPVTALKIDRSFVSRLGCDTGAESIVKAVIDMARNLRFTVVAEGVETEAQAAFLRLHRCDQAQGYLFGRPVPAEEAMRLLGLAGASGTTAP